MKKIMLFFLIISIFLPGPLSANAKTISGAGYIELPVIMYHDISNTKNSRYAVSAKQLEEDLIAFNKEGFVSVFPSEVLKFTEGKGNLPSKPIMLTFDDGHYNNLHYGLPLFEKYNYKGVINVIGSFCNYSTISGDDSNIDYSYLTWAQIDKLNKSGHFEIGSHTYNMHKYKPRFGIKKIENETAEEYKKALSDDLTKLNNYLLNKSNVTTNIFAYPFGACYFSSKELISSFGFKIIFTTDIGVNKIAAGNFDALKQLKRFNRESNYTCEKLMSVIAGGNN